MMTAEPGLLLFGTELASGARRRFAWVVVDGRAEGLGWGYVTALGRRVTAAWHAPWLSGRAPARRRAPASARAAALRTSPRRELHSGTGRPSATELSDRTVTPRRSRP